MRRRGTRPVRGHETIPRARQYALLAASGAALSLAFPPIDFLPAAFLALVPFFYVLRHTRVTGFWSAFRPGLVAGISFFVPLLYWLVLLSANEMDNPIVMSGPLVLLVLLESSYWGLFSAAAVLVTRRTAFPSWLALPILWVACEQLRSLFIMGLTWGDLGYAGVVFPRVVQFASVTGVLGVSFWMALVSALVLELLEGGARRRRAVVVGLVLALVLPAAHGTLVMSRGYPERTIRVAVLQPNIEGKKKWDADYKHVSFDVLGELSAEAGRHEPDLVVWPETAAPSYLLRDETNYRRVVEAAVDAGCPVLTGMPDVEYLSNEPGDHVVHNSVLLVMPDGSHAGKYDKIHLVPFGEVIPGATLIPVLRKVDFGEADFAPGEERVVFELHAAKFSVLICYESIFPRLVRQFVAGGAELLVNVTNDVWYGRTSMPFQHASMAVMRSIENRRSLARSANSGVSLVVDPYGRVLERTPIFERTLIVYDLPVVEETTFYSRHGDVFAWTMLVLAGLLVAASIAFRSARQSPHLP